MGCASFEINPENGWHKAENPQMIISIYKISQILIWSGVGSMILYWFVK